MADPTTDAEFQYKLELLRKQIADSGLNEEALATLSPEQRAEQYFDYEGTGEAIDDRQLQSQGALDRGLAGTDMVTVGDQTVAADKWSGLASVLQSGIGAYGVNKARKEKEANSARSAKASETLAGGFQTVRKNNARAANELKKEQQLEAQRMQQEALMQTQTQPQAPRMGVITNGNT
jgi:hypothetical protein